MKAANYFENEAELSGSEASEDEDEKGQNHYEAELGDLDHFDNDKIRSELERMALYVSLDYFGTSFSPLPFFETASSMRVTCYDRSGLLSEIILCDRRGDRGKNAAN